MTDVKKLSCTSSEMARVLGVSATNITNLEKSGTIRKEKSGKFNLASTVIAYISAIKSKKTESEANYETARARKMESSADIEEMNAAQKRGELIEIDSVVDVVETEYAIVRQRLFAIPNKVALDVFSCEKPQEVQELILTQVNEALIELKFDIGSEVIGVEGEGLETVSENTLS